jgi:predicted permease
MILLTIFHTHIQLYLFSPPLFFHSLYHLQLHTQSLSLLITLLFVSNSAIFSTWKYIDNLYFSITSRKKQKIHTIFFFFNLSDERIFIFIFSIAVGR